MPAAPNQPAATDQRAATDRPAATNQDDEVSPDSPAATGTRERILAVALELFARQGYAGTSIRDITERMGFTKASLYYHYRSKEDILREVTRPIKEDFEALAAEAFGDQPPSPSELLTKLVDVLSRRVALIRTFMGDPSAYQGQRPPAERLSKLATVLSSDQSTEGQARAMCALGAAQFGTFMLASAAAAADPPFGPDADQDRVTSILAGTEHLLSPAQRQQIVAAALRALSPD